MPKKQIDARVRAAMALHADRETALRDLAGSVDKIEARDVKIAKLVQDRNAALSEVEDAHQAARSAGWKARELAEVNLAVPTPIDFGLLATPAPAGERNTREATDPTTSATQ